MPLPALLVVGLVVLAATGVAGRYVYRTYDYVQHDNEFCVSCHLMQEPFERFARSEHRGLGCKACHRPSLIERSTMGLTQIVEDPDSLGVHAEVPNEVCADCHIEGDPETWAIVANSAGHRIHLESEDPELAGLRCVECHSTSVHEFAAVDRTCSQSSCHVDSQLQLGAMSELAVHCVACHGFSESTPGDVGSEAFAEALAPDRDTCLTCHEMRVLVALPDPDPHEGACAACHDPHTQATPAEAVQSCVGGACHVDVQSLTPHHSGVSGETLADCLYCHQAHDFALDGADCLSCHTGILRDDPTVPRRGGPPPPAGAPDTTEGGGTPGRVGSADGRAGPEGGVAFAALDLSERPRAALALHAEPSRTARVQAGPDFLHSEHPSVTCTGCHTSGSRHGELTVTTLDDCRSCHHAEDDADACVACHADSGTTGDPYPVRQRLTMERAGERERVLSFDHGPHEVEACATCHVDGPALQPTGLDCASCHQDHHDPEVACVACHEPARPEAHPAAQVHRTCSGAGCHTEASLAPVPRTRQVCLGCHQDQLEHRPEEPNCAECHALSGAGVPEG